jgi:hypothetical protein
MPSRVERTRPGIVRVTSWHSTEKRVTTIVELPSSNGRELTSPRRRSTLVKPFCAASLCASLPGSRRYRSPVAHAGRRRTRRCPPPQATSRTVSSGPGRAASTIIRTASALVIGAAELNSVAWRVNWSAPKSYVAVIARALAARVAEEFRVKCAPDAPVEQAGFELSVPLANNRAPFWWNRNAYRDDGWKC